MNGKLFRICPLLLRNLSPGLFLQLDDRKVQLRSTWEGVAKMVKKAEVHKDDLKEQSDAEIQRSGQPLCIYEPYHGEGAWAFLHNDNTLYRGVSLVSNFTMYSVVRIRSRCLSFSS